MKRLRSSAVWLLTAVVLLGGQAGALVHLVLVEHQRCPEHGELVHARRVEGPRVGAAESPGQRVGPLNMAAEADVHDHCLALLELPRPGQVAATAAPNALAPPLSLPLPRLTPEPSVPLLHLAPKSSPPRVA